MKYVKYALIALAPVVLIVGLLFAMGSGDGLPDGIKVVNVVTGETQSFDRDSRKEAAPYKNSSGERVFYPVVEEDGQLVIKHRYRDMFMQRFADKDTAVDKQSFVINAKN